MWRSGEKLAIYKPRGEASEDTKPADTLILDFQPPELWENKYLIIKQHTVWYFIMTATENEYGPDWLGLF